jgi:colicin import membrane protein
MNTAVHSESYKLSAGILAVAVHGAFFALLYFGFTWQTLSPATMSVELWQNLPDAMVVAVAPPPEAKIEKIAPPAQPEEAAKPEIVLPEGKSDMRLAEQQAAREKTERVAREKAERVAREKAERTAREKAERVAHEKAERVAREEAERVALERAEQAAAIGRVVDEYTGKIVSKVRSNIVMPPDVANDAHAEFLVTLLPGGTVLSAKLTRSSGHAVYDDNVERAILKSQPLPLPADVAMFNRFRELKLVFRPKQ